MRDIKASMYANVKDLEKREFLISLGERSSNRRRFYKQEKKNENVCTSGGANLGCELICSPTVMRGRRLCGYMCT